MKHNSTIAITASTLALLASACASNDSAGSSSSVAAATSAAAIAAVTTIGATTTGQSAPTSTTPATTSNAAPVPSTAPAVVDKIDVPDGSSYAPQIDPTNFTHPVDNPYLPFMPGMKWTYQGVDEEGNQETTAVDVSADTKTVMGIAATDVHDLVQVGGRTVEDTHDWYAQDDDGNVWYLGEDTTAYDSKGSTSKEGSWEGGVGGALPGIVMPATPAVTGAGYRQEYLKGSAEDTAIVVAAGGDQSVGADTYHDVVVTQEWTPLEPDVTEQKSYAPGVGVITEDIIRGATEHVELAGFTPVS